MHSIFNYCIPSIEIPNYVQKIYGNIRVPIKTYYNKLKCSFSYQFQIELLEKGHIFVIVLASKCEAFLAFVFSKKATKFDEIFAIDLTLTLYIIANRR